MTDTFALDKSKVELLKTQVAGHGNILHCPPDLVLKPLSLTEMEFYTHAQPPLKDLLLPLFGTVSLDDKKYLVLKDAASSFSKPCIADIKIGTRQYGLDVSAEKMAIQDEKCKNTTSSTLGLRLCGCRVWYHEKTVYNVTGKYQHRCVNATNVHHALAAFFSNGTEVLGHISELVASQVREICSIVSCLLGARMWGSSLLIVYEGDPTRPPNAITVPIDFSHSYVSGDHEDLCGVDEGYVYGLSSLIDVLERVPTSDNWHDWWVIGNTSL